MPSKYEEIDLELNKLEEYVKRLENEVNELEINNKLKEKLIEELDKEDN